MMLLLGSVVFLSTLGSVAAVDCLAGYAPSQNGKKCYSAIDDKINYNGAANYCWESGLGARLVTISDSFENSEVRALSGNDIWIGLNKYNPTKAWRWDSPPSVNSVFDNFAPDSGAYSWAYMRSNKFWYTSADSSQLSFACEHPAMGVNPCNTNVTSTQWPFYYHVDSQSCSHIHYLLQDFTSTKTACLTYGAKLPKVTSAEVNNFLMNLYPWDVASFDSNNMAWIGLRVVNNEFVWTDGSKFIFPKDYNNFKSITLANGDCVALNLSTGEWTMQQCTKNYLQLCMKPAQNSQWQSTTKSAINTTKRPI